jgi:hypothetical protein
MKLRGNKNSLSRSFATYYRSSEARSVDGIRLLNAIKEVAKRWRPDVPSWAGHNIQIAILPYHSPSWDGDLYQSLHQLYRNIRRLDPKVLCQIQ